MQQAARGRRRSPADQIVEQLRAADRFPTGDARRAAAQRRAARLAAADPAVLDHPSLAHVRSRLRQWARFAPYLLSDPDEARIASASRAVVGEQLSLLRSLEDEPTTALAGSDVALRDLDSHEPATRRAADVLAHRATDHRAPRVAPVLATLAACHLADDQQRGIDDWRTRFAIVQGTTPATLAHLRSATGAARGLAQQWMQLRSTIVGGEYCDRRVGLEASPASLAEHALQASVALGAAVPRLAKGAQLAAARIRPGADNQVVIEADGRISATVAHRPTPRGSLMVAHEVGHALHALESRSPEPPGALVGETVACWASLVTGTSLAVAGGDGSQALALALGDTLVEELFVSGAVSSFEDAVYLLVHNGSGVTDAALDEAWLAVHRELLGSVVEVPAHVGSGWARLPSLATDPGHALSYVWATVLALAIDARHAGDADGVIARAIVAGGVDADEFTALLGFEGDEWVEAGFGALALQLTRLGQVVGAGMSSRRAC